MPPHGTHPAARDRPPLGCSFRYPAQLRSPATTEGDVPDEREYPTLLEKLADDLADVDPGCPVLIAVTGDMAQAETYEELKKAEEFTRGLTRVPLLVRARSFDDIFVVPGNDDVLYDKVGYRQALATMDSRSTWLSKPSSARRGRAKLVAIAISRT